MSKISFIVTTFKRENYLNQLISSIEQNLPNDSYEIIVVSSDDPNSEKIKNLKLHNNVKVLNPDVRTDKRLRSLYYYENIGIKQAQYEWIFVTNDDTVIINTFFTEFLKVEKDYDVIFVGGHIGMVQLGRRIPTIGKITKHNEVEKDLYLSDFTLIRKNIYEKIEFLDENLDWYGKGCDLTLKIEFLTNSRILYESNISVDHLIAIENRFPGEIDDFGYIRKKWDVWCNINVGYSYYWP